MKKQQTLLINKTYCLTIYENRNKVLHNGDNDFRVLLW
jgi:hypothetical protein